MDDIESGGGTHDTARVPAAGIPVELAIDLFPIVMAVVLFTAVYIGVTD